MAEWEALEKAEREAAEKAAAEKAAAEKAAAEKAEWEALEKAEREATERAAAEKAAAEKAEREAAEKAAAERELAEKAAAEAEKRPEEVRPEQPELGDGESTAIVPTRPFAPREYKPPERPKPYEVPAGVEFNGDLLRQVRMARGLSLLQLSERTRIGVRHIENLENDRYEQLPAMVYLRGMLMSVARELGLDGLRVSKSYLTFVEAHLAKSKG